MTASDKEGDKTQKEGAARETLEETGEEVKVGDLLTIIDVPDANQVHFFFRAELQDINGVPGEETLEQRLFSEEEIPWEMLSFTTVKTTLRHYFDDFHAGKFELHTYKILKLRSTLTNLLIKEKRDEKSCLCSTLSLDVAYSQWILKRLTMSSWLILIGL